MNNPMAAAVASMMSNRGAPGQAPKGDRMATLLPILKQMAGSDPRLTQVIDALGSGADPAALLQQLTANNPEAKELLGKLQSGANPLDVARGMMGGQKDSSSKGPTAAQTEFLRQQREVAENVAALLVMQRQSALEMVNLRATVTNLCTAVTEQGAALKALQTQVLECITQPSPATTGEEKPDEAEDS